MRDNLQLDTVIATRDLKFTRPDGSTETVVVSIGAPVPGGDDAWVCPYLIQAESFHKHFRMVGGDSMQALVHTVHILADELGALSRKHGGTFNYLGGSDLMLPLAESLGSS